MGLSHEFLIFSLQLRSIYWLTSLLFSYKLNVMGALDPLVLLIFVILYYIYGAIIEIKQPKRSIVTVVKITFLWRINIQPKTQSFTQLYTCQMVGLCSYPKSHKRVEEKGHKFLHWILKGETFWGTDPTALWPVHSHAVPYIFSLEKLEMHVMKYW